MTITMTAIAFHLHLCAKAKEISQKETIKNIENT